MFPSKKASDGCQMPFHSLLILNAGGAITVAANPTGLSSRATAEGDSWAHFRLRRLRFRILPNDRVIATSGGFSSITAGFVGGIQDTPPATQITIGELLPSITFQGTQTVPTKWVDVPKNDLAGPLPWYKSVPGTADPTEEAPGQLVIFAVLNTVAVTYLELEGVFEFKTSVATANTPLEERLRSQIRAERKRAADDVERRKLLLVLGTKPPATG